jgi:tRNA threonylcarbamoyladenosine biosynthesis protein TsaE
VMSSQPLVLEKNFSTLKETIAFAHRLASVLCVADIVTLSGTLGAGKTEFIRAILRSIIEPTLEVPSPTFNLLLTYDIPEKEVTIYHYDLYRIELPEEVLELDIDDAFDHGITLIEWADRMGSFLPETHLDINLTADADKGEEYRIISLRGDKAWQERLSFLSAGQNA